ncbi:hypothetical protein ERO13_D13G201650v2 [Gossypium hirsutum]|nr:hypothetical protein ERO13_D13G201650v2 [Gossypium hirsutum]
MLATNGDVLVPYLKTKTLNTFHFKNLKRTNVLRAALTIHRLRRPPIFASIPMTAERAKIQPSGIRPAWRYGGGRMEACVARAYGG